MLDYKVENPEYQFKCAKVRVLSSMSYDLDSSLRKLVCIYNSEELPFDNIELFHRFVMYLSCDLMYPIQVLLIDSDDEK